MDIWIFMSAFMLSTYKKMKYYSTCVISLNIASTWVINLKEGVSIEKSPWGVFKYQRYNNKKLFLWYKCFKK